jgi:hypothetical protein
VFSFDSCTSSPTPYHDPDHSQSTTSFLSSDGSVQSAQNSDSSYLPSPSPPPILHPAKQLHQRIIDTPTASPTASPQKKKWKASSSPFSSPQKKVKTTPIIASPEKKEKSQTTIMSATRRGLEMMKEVGKKATNTLFNYMRQATDEEYC